MSSFVASRVPLLIQRAVAVARTCSVLSSSPSLTKNLASLAYHHHPHPLPHTNNSRRMVSAPPTFVWDPQAPQAASKAFEAETRKRAKDPAVDLGEQALNGLERLVRLAEMQDGVMLGRLERAPKGRG